MKIGDVVKVKAKNGPKMTVNSLEVLSGINTAECVWFEGYDLHKDFIEVDALEEVVNPV